MQAGLHHKTTRYIPEVVFLDHHQNALRLMEREHGSVSGFKTLMTEVLDDGAASKIYEYGLALPAFGSDGEWTATVTATAAGTSGSAAVTVIDPPPLKTWVGGDTGDPASVDVAANWSPPGVPMAANDVLAGTINPEDGLADPNGVVTGYIAAARRLEEKIQELGVDNVAAFIAEPIQGAGGVIDRKSVV